MSGRCVAPTIREVRLQHMDLDLTVRCREPATTTRVVEGLEAPLCSAHACELDTGGWQPLAPGYLVLIEDGRPVRLSHTCSSDDHCETCGTGAQRRLEAALAEKFGGAWSLPWEWSAAEGELETVARVEAVAP